VILQYFCNWNLITNNENQIIRVSQRFLCWTNTWEFQKRPFKCTVFSKILPTGRTKLSNQLLFYAKKKYLRTKRKQTHLWRQYNPRFARNLSLVYFITLSVPNLFYSIHRVLFFTFIFTQSLQYVLVIYHYGIKS